MTSLVPEEFSRHHPEDSRREYRARNLRGPVSAQRVLRRGLGLVHPPGDERARLDVLLEAQENHPRIPRDCELEDVAEQEHYPARAHQDAQRHLPEPDALRKCEEVVQHDEEHRERGEPFCDAQDERGTPGSDAPLRLEREEHALRKAERAEQDVKPNARRKQERSRDHVREA